MIVKYCLVYRSGGTENFRWHRSLAMTQEQAVSRAIELERMGYKVYIANYDHSVAIGLPNTFEFSNTASY